MIRIATTTKVHRRGETRVHRINVPAARGGRVHVGRAEVRHSERGRGGEWGGLRGAQREGCVRTDGGCDGDAEAHSDADDVRRVLGHRRRDRVERYRQRVAKGEDDDYVRKALDARDVRKVAVLTFRGRVAEPLQYILSNRDEYARADRSAWH